MDVCAARARSCTVILYVQGEAVQGKRFSVVAEYVLRVLGLDYISDTFVGGPMLRGISGGQKKRLTTGEMLVGCARALVTGFRWFSGNPTAEGCSGPRGLSAKPEKRCEAH